MEQLALAKKTRLLLIALSGLILITGIIGMGIGYASLSFDRLLPTLLGYGTFNETFVLYDIRLPRIAVTLLSGMALALSGAILQHMTRNDLADPGIVGINAGAGIAIAVYFLFFPIDTGAFVYLLPAVGFIGALLTACAIYACAYSKTHGLQPIRLVLVGVGFSLALSGAMVVLISAAEPFKVDFIARWLAGSIWGTSWPFVFTLLPWLLALVPLALYKAHTLNLLTLKDDVTVGVGVELGRERAVLLLIAVALAASAVSVTGGISFIGLMAPHMAKALVGPRSQSSLPLSILLGGWMLMLADLIGRNIVPPEGVPAGIVAAFIGAPYFIYLLLRK